MARIIESGSPLAAFRGGEEGPRHFELAKLLGFGQQIVRRGLSLVSWSLAHSPAVPGRVRTLPEPVALILGDPQAGPAFEAPGSALGMFLILAAGP